MDFQVYAVDRETGKAVPPITVFAGSEQEAVEQIGQRRPDVLIESVKVIGPPRERPFAPVAPPPPKPKVSASILTLLTAAVALLATIAVFLAIQTFRPDAPPPGQQEWEYKLESPYDALFEMEMAKLGKEGWELVFARRATSSAGGSASYEMIFKRPKR